MLTDGVGIHFPTSITAIRYVGEFTNLVGNTSNRLSRIVYCSPRDQAITRTSDFRARYKHATTIKRKLRYHRGESTRNSPRNYRAYWISIEGDRLFFFLFFAFVSLSLSLSFSLCIFGGKRHFPPVKTTRCVILSRSSDEIPIDGTRARSRPVR